MLNTTKEIKEHIEANEEVTRVLFNENKDYYVYEVESDGDMEELEKMYQKHFEQYSTEMEILNGNLIIRLKNNLINNLWIDILNLYNSNFSGE